MVRKDFVAGFDIDEQESSKNTTVYDAKAVMQFIQNNGYVCAKDLVKLTGLSPERVREKIREMKNCGIYKFQEVHSDYKGGACRIVDQNNEVGSSNLNDKDQNNEVGSSNLNDKDQNNKVDLSELKGKQWRIFYIRYKEPSDNNFTDYYDPCIKNLFILSGTKFDGPIKRHLTHVAVLVQNEVLNETVELNKALSADNKSTIQVQKSRIKSLEDSERAQKNAIKDAVWSILPVVKEDCVHRIQSAGFIQEQIKRQKAEQEVAKYKALASERLRQNNKAEKQIKELQVQISDKDEELKKLGTKEKYIEDELVPSLLRILKCHGDDEKKFWDKYKEKCENFIK